MSLSDEQKDALAVVHEGIYGDPELRRDYERLVAKKFPKAKAAMPELAAQETIEAGLAEMRKEREAWKAEREEAERKGDTAARRKRLTDGFTAPDGSFVKIAPEDVVKVEALMLERGNGDHESAAWFWTRSQEVGKPRSRPDSSMLIPGLKGAGGDTYKWLEAGIKGDASDLDRAARAEAYRVWDEVTSGRVVA
jgi:hypothetical protein